MNIRTAAAAASLALLVLVAPACGGDDDKPSKGEISESLQETGSLDKETADCAADAYLDADISADGIDKLLDSDYSSGSAESADDIGLSESDGEKVQKATQVIVTDCFDLPDDTGSTEPEG